MSTEMKWTPGPWCIQSKLTSSENHRGYCVRDINGWSLADVKPGDEDGALGKANATLIAAAPELYKALEAMLKEFNEDTTLILGGMVHDEFMAIINAREALKKARGE